MPPQYSAHTRKHFTQIKRLGYIIVRPKLEPDNSVDGVSLPRNHDDRHVARGANLSCERQTIVAPESEI